VNIIVESPEPINIFELIVTDKIVDHIVRYFNLYAEKMMANKKYKKSSRLAKWEDITAPEIRLYLAVLVYKGLLYKPKEHPVLHKKKTI